MQKRLTPPLLFPPQGGTGRNTLPAGGVLAGSSNQNLLSVLNPSAAGDVIRSISGVPTISPGDRIIQVVSGTNATQLITTSTTWVATGLSVAITPLFTDSSFLVWVNQTGVGKYNNGSSDCYAGLSLWRDASMLVQFAYPIGYTNNNSSSFCPGGVAHIHSDTPTIPATPVPITYSTRICLQGTPGASVITQWGGSGNSVSTIVVMEVASS